MSFPQTRHTLIQRLSSGGDERDWSQFLADYWGPICRFARRSGAPTWQDAEDIASETFAALLKNRLLPRWLGQQSAKLRTLLCAVTRNVLNNRVRVEQGRDRLLREHIGPNVDASLEESAEQEDSFYTTWVEDLVHQAVAALLEHYHREGKGDHFRVLYGRLCDGMSLPEIARALSIELTKAENAYKQARQRLTAQLEELVRAHVGRYCPEEEAAAEFTGEWGQLAEHLRKHGELEAAVRRAFESGSPPPERRSAAYRSTLSRIKGECGQPSGQKPQVNSGNSSP